jgi:DNA-directed RNA polymerase specialized sigma24 family protein
MIEPAPQQDSRINVTPMLMSAREGDETAFNRLMQVLCPPILSALRKQGASADDAEDALSKAMLIIYRLLRQNRFDAMQTGGFVAYFRTVAIHEWMHRPEVRRAIQSVPLTVLDADTGETVDLDVPDESQPLHERVANLSLYDFLMRQLDEVFVAGRTGPERCRGELEKLAFIYFYQDGMTQLDIYDILSVLGGNFPHATPVTRADLNNWLSMGRSLKSLLRHLAERHAEIAGMLVDLHLSELNLPLNVAEPLRLFYRERLSVEEIAADQGMAIVEVRQALAIGKKELIEGLARTIKAQLKVSRSG